MDSLKKAASIPLLESSLISPSSWGRKLVHIVIIFHWFTGNEFCLGVCLLLPMSNAMKHQLEKPKFLFIYKELEYCWGHQSHYLLGVPKWGSKWDISLDILVSTGSGAAEPEFKFWLYYSLAVKLSMPQFPHLKHGDSDTWPTEFLWG